MRILLILAGLSGLAAFNAPAQDDPCGNAVSQSELNQCSGERYKLADSALNQVYKQVQGKLDKAQWDKLREAQRAWIAFRDAECVAQSFPYQGGSMQALIVNDCLNALTKTRTEDLRRVYLEQSPANGVDAQALVGTWRSLNPAYGMELQLGIQQGVHHYYSQLNGVPFEAGQWQLRQNQLLITSSTGKLLRSYSQVQLENSVLTLFEADGGVERYQKAPEKGIK
jgi:uncharacterized protein YecT (DUF1311 family)